MPAVARGRPSAQFVSLASLSIAISATRASSGVLKGVCIKADGPYVSRGIEHLLEVFDKLVQQRERHRFVVLTTHTIDTNLCLV